MSQNTHTGVSSNRRPVSRDGAKKRVKHTTEILEFLAKRAKNEDK
ncbi:hypothetical protein [Schleiferilactobacillus perolens]|nr:hypothetical protein [Schleiferilactobacillus perolens]